MGETTRARLAAVAAPTLVGVAVLLAWQAGCRLWHIPPYLMPAPGDIGAALVQNGWALLHALRSTLLVTMIALGLSAVLGVLVAFLLVQSRMIERSLMPYVIVMQVTPIVAVAPLIIILVKTTLPALVICATLIAIFPIISNTLQGLRSVDPGLAAFFRMHKATRVQTLLRLQVPSAVPMFMAGLRISSGLALVGAVVAEFVAGTGGNSAGLAYEILQSGFQMDIPRMFAALALITLAGLVLYGVMAGLQQWVLRRWHEHG
ncbi:ABC transporter permease [Nguyenibacter vanlangensis]|uniref:ABC transporter permease n=1 Tax=Nguyenibacter vanlangensis TaxID=1216886 RepID=A0ABZ3D8N2_9PROT